MFRLPSPSSSPEASPSSPNTEPTSDPSRPLKPYVCGLEQTWQGIDRLSLEYPDAPTWIHTWHDLILGLSLYSPPALSHLRPPRPNDAPPHLDDRSRPSVFTFKDAYEDLMVASRGEPLPDLTTLYEQRINLARQGPLLGKDTLAWLIRLKLKGLIDISIRESVVQAVMFSSEWALMHEGLDLSATEVLRTRLGRSLPDLPSVSELLEELDHLTDGFQGPVSCPDVIVHRPETEHDLYTIRDSDFVKANSQTSSWDTFINSIFPSQKPVYKKKPPEVTRVFTNLQAVALWHEMQRQKKRAAVSGNQILILGSFSNLGGYHTVHSINRLNKDGSLKSSMVNTSTRPAREVERVLAKLEKDNPTHEQEEMKVWWKKEGTLSWFWKY